MAINVKDATTMYAYKSILDLQQQLMNQLIQMLPQDNMQSQMQNVVELDMQKFTPPPNPDGKISIYA